METSYIKLNREELKDKIYACWVGKNIGGTIGTPYEGTRDFLDIKGFASEKGEPLPNDDLDLQLVWLRAMQQVGPSAVNANVLAEYWITHITPYWNEYGIGKANIGRGLLAPACGEFNNATWKNSNGAWIRSEIWACLAPGFPNISLKYAIMDASVDHGMGEGMYAEIFTASMETTAFTETDIRKIIETALTYIPEDCRVSQCVRKVLEEYDKHTDYKEVREMLVEMNKDLGWFQAPANIGFVTIGLMYGEGDFKKSVIYAVNCGDDTDCTGATVGAFLGILGGTKSIPKDWQEYIGDRIVPICINGSYRYIAPKTCTELTRWVMDTIPSVFRAHGIYMEYTDGENECDKEWAVQYLREFDSMPQEIFRYSPYSFTFTNNMSGSLTIDYGKEPVIKPGEEFEIKYTIENKLHEYYADVKLFLPEGWTASYKHTVYICSTTVQPSEYRYTTNSVIIKAGENVSSRNDIIFHITSPTRAMPFTVAAPLFG